MPEFETRRPAAPSYVPPIRSTAEADDEEFTLATVTRTGEGPLQREGLPAGYRMRHEPHYVEQLAARAPGVQVRAIPIRDIDTDRRPDAREIEPLVRSIDAFGILHPLHVRHRAGRFELVAGARRLAAAASVGLSEVPCIVHTIDDVRAAELREADNVRGQIEPGQPQPAAAEDAPRAALEELRQSLGTVESCLHLLTGAPAALRDRVALDLVRMEVHRVHRLVRSLHVLAGKRTIAPVVQSCRLLVEQALDATEPERRLSGIQLAADLAEGPHEACVDPEAFGTAIAGALGGMMALLQHNTSPSLQVRVSTSTTRKSVLIEIAQHSVSVSGTTLTRFFDPCWTERPGGYQAAVELAAARTVVELHGGSIELTAGERGGCRMVMAVPGTVPFSTW